MSEWTLICFPKWFHQKNSVYGSAGTITQPNNPVIDEFFSLLQKPIYCHMPLQKAFPCVCKSAFILLYFNNVIIGTHVIQWTQLDRV